jgi:DNA helicase-2/ATP-dependent DNA helicase PcrA
MVKLNKEQARAVNSKSDRILCLAGAGAGKTATMLERVSHLVKEGTPPSSIMALTFTNAAAAEMRERYESKNLGKETPEFRTFHSFCYSLVCRDPNIRTALDYKDVPMIASEAQEKEIEVKAKTQCNITLSKEQLKERIGLTKKEQFQVDLFDKAVTRLMRSANIITFDRLNSEVADLFASDHIATQPYKNRYKYIFVDEFQDTDSYQIKFLNSFPDTHFYFCGDVLQEIYRFRGTSNEFIKVLANAPDWEKIKLFTNYRSTNQICEYANKFSQKYADPSYRIEMQGIRDGDRVITKLVNGPGYYSAIDSSDIDDVLTEREKLQGTSAIICRTNKEVSAIIAYLKSHDVEFTTSKDVKIQKIIDCALSESYMLGLMASYLSTNKYGEYIRLSAQTEKPDLEWFLHLYGNTPQIKEDVKNIKDLKDIAFTGFSTNDKIDKVTELFHIKNIQKTDTFYFGNEFLTYLQEAVSNIKSSELYVGTIHSVKGLEYDNVFVMNVGSYCFRLEDEEMKNLFYVAITRAKNHLFVYELFDD